MSFSSHYNLSNDFRIELSNPVVADLAMWYGELTFPSYQHEDASVPNIMQVSECNHMVESPESMTLFSKYHDVSDMGLRTCFSSITGNECSQYNQLLEGEQCSGLVSNFWPIYPPTNDSFHETNEKSAKGLEEPTMRVGKCSVEERKDKIMKYLKKRNQRNFNKTIKYACRKTLADKRVRVRGRFAKNNEPCEFVEEDAPRKNYYHQNPHHEEPTQSFYGNHILQMKKDYEEVEEDWLEEAMTTLMYSPALYIHGYDDHSMHS